MYRHTPQEMARNLKILLADDHPMLREGFKPLLGKLAERVDIHEAGDYPGVFEAAGRETDLDLVLLDLYMPGMPGLDGIRAFRAHFPDHALVVMSAANEPKDIQRIMEAGALGYINKATPGEEILSALRGILAGKPCVAAHGPFHPASAPSDGPIDPQHKLSELSPRQMSVLRGLLAGKSNSQIAEELGVTEGTVKTHLYTIFRILGVHSRTEALLAAQRLGLHD